MPNRMYVIVVGAGKVGWNLTRELLEKGHEVTLIDNGMPVVLLRASDVGVTGHETCDQLEADARESRRCGSLVRGTACLDGLARRMGEEAAREIVAQPVGTVRLALGDGQLYLGHAPIIRWAAAGTRQ